MALARGTVRLDRYKEVWAEWFADEADRLRGALGKHVEIEHIGSTAVPGLIAKPIIDMMVGVEQLEDVTADMIARLEELGYRFMPERATKDEIFMLKGPDSHRTHYLHIVPRSNLRWHNTIMFRNYLRAHDDVRDEYAALKEQLALKFADDRENYTLSKAEFVAGVLSRARHHLR